MIALYLFRALAQIDLYIIAGLPARQPSAGLNSYTRVLLPELNTAERMSAISQALAIPTLRQHIASFLTLDELAKMVRLDKIWMREAALMLYHKVDRPKRARPKALAAIDDCVPTVGVHFFLTSAKPARHCVR